MKILGFLKELKDTFVKSPLGFSFAVLMILGVVVCVVDEVGGFIEHMQYRSTHQYEEDYDVVPE